MVPDVVSAVTVIHAMLFVLHVCPVRVTEMLVWGPGEVWFR